MSRWWTDQVAALGDVIGLGLATLFLLLAAGLAALAWYFWPRWLPWRWWRWHPRWRWGWPWQWYWRWPWRLSLRWRWRRRRPKAVAGSTAEVTEVAVDELPDVPAQALASLADQYAAQGRYAEAVRERLRAIVRELVDTGVIDHRPGWTVTELARAAGAARPAVAPPLSAASLLFSDIWYGQRPAYPEHDGRMRGYAADVHAVLAGVPAGGVR